MSDKELQLSLMGGLQLTLGATEITDQISTKGQALICYLALTKRPQPRGAITGLLWGDKREKDARRSLRVELSKLRTALGAHMIVTRHSVGLDVENAFWSDVDAFESYLQRSRQSNTALDPANVQEAVKLYRGDFLAGFDARDAISFEEWMLGQRERLRLMAINALDSLVEYYIDQRSYSAGVEYAQQLLVLDSWRETTHRQLMWLLANSGQRNAALAQFEICREILQSELGVVPQSETLALFRQIRNWEGVAPTPTRELPPLPQATINPFQAPASVPYFTGRVGEVGFLSRRLQAPEGGSRLALVGMGGVGKSALALHLAHRLRDVFPDGVLWAHAGTGDPNAIIENWSEAYGYDFSGLPDLGSRAAALRQVLADKRALLILDNVTYAARIRPLLPDLGSTCALLMTMRNSELATALHAETVPLQEMDDSSARALMVRIIGAERAAAEKAAVAEACSLLQNLPLAVAVIAQRLAARPRRRIQDMVAQLRDETQRLSQLAAQDRAVRASIAISWNGLDQVQQHIFGLLAVFNGRAFTAHAMAAVADIDSYGAMDRLDGLVTLSLLQEEGEQHYRQHALLADFAREQLDDLSAPARRMVDYYLGFARRCRQAYAELRPEWENLSAAVQSAYEQQMWPAILDFTDTLRPAWFARGRYDEARLAYKRAQRAAKELSDDRAMARVWLEWGQASLEQSDFDEADAQLRHSLNLYEQFDDQAGIAATKYHLARLALERADAEQAETLLDESHRLRFELKDFHGQAEIVYTKARLKFRQVELEEALQLGERALQMQEQIEDKPGMIRTLRLLTSVTSYLKDNETAEGYGNRAIDLCQDLGERSELAVTLRVMATVHRIKGEYVLAEELAEKSLQLLQKIGDRRSQANVYLELLLIKRLTEEYDTAVSMAREGLAISRELEAPEITCWLLIYLGHVHILCGRHQQAEQILSEARQLAEQLHNERMLQLLQELGAQVV